MVRKSVYGVLVIFVLISCGYAEQKVNEDKKEPTDEKTVSKRGIFHVGVHGHVPHYHVPVVPKIPVITKIPTVIKPVVPAVLPAPVLPTLPYHITHGGAVTTSFSANYPRVPFYTKTVIPPALPVIPHHHHHHGFYNDFHHHHHHGYPSYFGHRHFYPHFHPIVPPHVHPVVPPHVHFHPKPIVPVAVPIPDIHHHAKIPVFAPSKPVFFNPPVAQPTFVPIPIPSNSQPANPGISSAATNHNQNHNNIFPTTQQTPIQLFDHSNHLNSQGNWQPTRPTVIKDCSPYNYHAALKKPSSSTNRFPSTNNFVSGQGPTVSQQLALYQQQQQLYNHHSKLEPIVCGHGI